MSKVGIALLQLLIHLDVLHDVVGQVVQHHPVIAFEEVAAVKQQVIHAPPVDGYLPVAAQRDTRQLLDQVPEHGAVL